MNEKDQQRFKYLCNEGELTKSQDMTELCSLAQTMYQYSITQQVTIEKFKVEERSLFRSWVHRFGNADAAEQWLLSVGYVLTCLVLVLAVTLSIYILHPPVPTERYYMRTSADGNCTQIMRDILYAGDQRVSTCLLPDQAKVRLKELMATNVIPLPPFQPTSLRGGVCTDPDVCWTEDEETPTREIQNE